LPCSFKNLSYCKGQQIEQIKLTISQYIVMVCYKVFPYGVAGVKGIKEIKHVSQHLITGIWYSTGGDPLNLLDRGERIWPAQ